MSKKFSEISFDSNFNFVSAYRRVNFESDLFDNDCDNNRNDFFSEMKFFNSVENYDNNESLF
jgi:hypothetical protein